jgi:hypothetical protein
MEKLLRAAVLETDTLLKAASPVDLGRFRASWQVGENAAPGGSRRQLFNHPANAQYSGNALATFYSVHNNLPYAEKLASGAAGSGSRAKPVTTLGAP